MYQTTIIEDKIEIINVLKSFLVGSYEAKKLIYTHIAYENIEDSLYNVTDYEDELYFTKSGRLWLSRKEENFRSDFQKKSIEDVRIKNTDGCISANKYIEQLRTFPINGELTVIKEVLPTK